MPSTAEQLPVWVEYVRALGTPSAALLGAIFAAYFFFRQWRTAQNKLKLDLFQKRLDIFNSAMEIARLMSQEGQIYFVALQAASNGLSGARWLYNKEVEAALYEMNRKANAKILDKPFAVPANLSDAETLELASKMIKKAGDHMAGHARLIAKLCDPFYFVALQAASNGLSGARWLYNKEVEAALYEMNRKANAKILDKPFAVPANLSDAETLELASKMIKKAGDHMAGHARLIAKLCDPFSSIEH